MGPHHSEHHWRAVGLGFAAAAAVGGVAIIGPSTTLAASISVVDSVTAYAAGGAAGLATVGLSPQALAAGIIGITGLKGLLTAATTAAETTAATNTAVVANPVLSAAPNVFTRAESLAGREAGRRVTEIAESMKPGGWQGDPIDVVQINGERIVMNGHRRLAAARMAGIDVQYRVVDPSMVIGPGQYASVEDILNATYTVGPDKLR